MTTSAKKQLLNVTLIVALIAVAGCNWLAWPFYVISPSRSWNTIDAEFDGLEDKRVAVVIVAEENLIYEYRDLQAQLGAIIGAELKKKKSKLSYMDANDLGDIETINPRRIVKYQNSNPDWDALDSPALARNFGADYLLRVTLIDYALREPGSQTLYRGYITARGEVFDVKLPPEKACVWSGDVEVTYPPQGHPVGRMADSRTEFRVETERRFAKELVKRFRTYKVRIKE